MTSALKQCQISGKAPTILVCIDTSNTSISTLKYACLKAKRLGFHIEILSIIDPSHKNILFGGNTIAKEKREKLEENLQKIITQINQETGITPAISIREGEIADQIIKEVKSNPCCTMLVFGKSQNSQSDNTVLPRIAQKIGKKIQIPIMIVPENLDENLFQLLL